MFPILNRNKENFNFRVKRAANRKNVNQFFRAMGNAFEDVYHRPRRQASLGTVDDLPTEIREGGKRFKPRIDNPLLVKAKEAIEKDRKFRNLQSKKSKKSGRYMKGNLLKGQRVLDTRLLDGRDLEGCSLCLLMLSSHLHTFYKGDEMFFFLHIFFPKIIF